MRNFKNLAFAICALTLGSQNSFAQNFPNKFQKTQKAPLIVTTPVAQPTQSAFSQDELKQIFGDNAPRPGIYSIRAIHSNKCLGTVFMSRALSGAFLNSFQTGECSSDNPPVSAQFAIIPHPFGGYTIRSLSSWNVPNTPNLNVGPYEQCATVSRDVVFGPAAILYQKCEMPATGVGNSQLGVEDQRVTFEKVAAKTYIVHTNNGECWDVQNQSMNIRVEIIRWACTGNPNQKFEFNYIGKITDKNINDNLAGQNYFISSSDGMWRVNNTPNISFTGTPYISFETKNDNGQECSNICLNDNRCVNWVYNFQDSAISPICSLRNNFSSPIRSIRTFGGSIRH